MKRVLSFLGCFLISLALMAQDANEILKRVDANLSSENRKIVSALTIHGKRNTRRIESLSYVVGRDQSFTEYLAPVREKGTKMLKMGQKLWLYTPATDRIVLISGHMLRQSVMGSDLSYEDMMDDRSLSQVYTATVTGTESLDDRMCYVLDLQASVPDLAYERQRLWVDVEWMVPLQQEMYAKRGVLLKRIRMDDVQRVDGRWFPMRMLYKDMLKDGAGTLFEVESVKFNIEIPEHVFSKASLRR